jgi:hypothetical protein
MQQQQLQLQQQIQHLTLLLPLLLKSLCSMG